MNFAPGYLASVINASLEVESRLAANFFDPGLNVREYNCKIEMCSRAAYAKGFCNAHYIRDRSGQPMEVPVRARKRDDACSECGEKTGAKGGWGLCSSHYKRKRLSTIKNALIQAFGGKCESCGGIFSRCVFDFHHLGKKEGDPSKIFGSRSVIEIASEIENCKLLCANCHRMEHNNGI